MNTAKNTVQIQSNEAGPRTVAYESVGPVAGHRTFDLKPGMNDVDADAWSKAQENATIKHLIETDVLVEGAHKTKADLKAEAAAEAKAARDLKE